MAPRKKGRETESQGEKKHDLHPEVQKGAEAQKSLEGSGTPGSNSLLTKTAASALCLHPETAKRRTTALPMDTWRCSFTAAPNGLGAHQEPGNRPRVQQLPRGSGAGGKGEGRKRTGHGAELNPPAHLPSHFSESFPKRTYFLTNIAEQFPLLGPPVSILLSSCPFSKT